MAARSVVVACADGADVTEHVVVDGAPAASDSVTFASAASGSASVDSVPAVDSVLASPAVSAPALVPAVSVGIVDRLAGVIDELADLATRGWAELSGPEAKRVVGLLERGARSSAAIQSGALSAVAKSEQWAADGNRNVNEWVARQTGRSKAQAHRVAKAAKELDENLPETLKALARGEISEDHVNAIATKGTRTRKHRQGLKDPYRGEKYLLTQARQMNATQFAKFVQGWAVERDPRAADRAWREDAKKEEVTLTPVAEGFVLKGWLTPTNGQILQTALAAHMGRKAADDEREFPQRRAQALVGLARQSLDAGLQMPHSRIRPHLTITMDYATLAGLVAASGPAIPADAAHALGIAGMDPKQRVNAEAIWAKNWQVGDDHVISPLLTHAALEDLPAATLPDGRALAPGELARLACDSMLNRVVFGPLSTILDAGRQERIFPANQARAIIARDRHCQYPGCDEGPEFAEIHHSLEWYKHNGTTHADLGILLCYGHHSHVHRELVTITRVGGKWKFTDRTGNEIRAPHPHQRETDPPERGEQLESGHPPTPGEPPAPETMTDQAALFTDDGYGPAPPNQSPHPPF